MRIVDLGTLPYRDAWAVQESGHEEVLSGGEERIFFVEHFPVITFGRRPGVERHLIAAPEELARRGVEVVQSDRGGDITFHGPGQLVTYPIIRLQDHGFSVSQYVHTLERAVTAALGDFTIQSITDPRAVGVWVGNGSVSSKICAIGVRIRRGVSLHGIALNVTTDLSFFDLIVPCGLAGRTVTSISKLLGPAAPDMAKAKSVLARRLIEHLAAGAAEVSSPVSTTDAQRETSPQFSELWE